MTQRQKSPLSCTFVSTREGAERFLSRLSMEGRITSTAPSLPLSGRPAGRCKTLSTIPFDGSTHSTSLGQAKLTTGFAQCRLSDSRQRGFVALHSPFFIGRLWAFAGQALHPRYWRKDNLSVSNFRLTGV